ncbi:hypothetical protein [Lysobacter brunescens]|uniref:Uncharacterized protein n=1 Tax=Lysobacter brunescens TaxID=262323 RepID=A0ABW2Y894_9GAMM
MNTAADLLQDPHYLPFQLDLANGRVLCVRLDAQQRREAAFLDPRALPPQPQGAWLALSILQAPDTGHTVADGIFHIGHCGSTLLSRLLDTWPEVEGLREPLPLRDLAAAWHAPSPPHALLATLMAYWRRPLPPASRVAIKVTSSCNVLIEPLLRDGGLSRAILLDMPLVPWLATLLKSEDSVRDALAAFDERAEVLRMHGIAIDGVHAPGDAIEACAMGWLAERLRFDALASGEFASRVLRVDFEDLLASPSTELARIAAHLSLDADGVAHALASPAWGRYSKAQQHDYGRDDRAHDLALAQQRFGAEIARGVAWVDRAMA